MDANELLEKLRQLNGKKEAGQLGKEDALELRRLKLEQKGLKLAKQKAAINAQKRKIDNQRKYELGGIVVKAGLNEFDNATLLGALLDVAKTKDASKLAQWREDGGAVYANDAREKSRSTQPLFVSFQAEPSDDIRAALRGKGFHWNAAVTRWEGNSNIDDVRALVAAANGTVEAA